MKIKPSGKLQDKVVGFNIVEVNSIKEEFTMKEDSPMAPGASSSDLDGQWDPNNPNGLFQKFSKTTRIAKSNECNARCSIEKVFWCF